MSSRAKKKRLWREQQKKEALKKEYEKINKKIKSQEEK